MYGCYPKKLAETLGKPLSEGQKLYDAFWDANPALAQLVRALERAYDQRGVFIVGLDGRPLKIREKRKLLNSLLQNAATMVFKKWMILCDEWITNNHMTAYVKQVIAYHDELQFISKLHKDDLKNVADNLCTLAKVAGKHFGCEVETPADYRIGKNWSETH